MSLLPRLARAAVTAGLLVSCHRERSTSSAPSASSIHPSLAAAPERPAEPAAAAPPPAPPAPVEPPPPPPPRVGQEIGPFEIPFLGKRTVYYGLPASRARPHRLIANLHGICNPPGYSCGYWMPSASERGVMVCPRGNTECAPGVSSWSESVEMIDEDLEKAIAAVDLQHPGEIARDGAFLTGFSLGASVAPLIAKRHAGRWPYLILIEATVALDADQLRKAGVKGVALIAGEIGENVYGQRNIAAALTRKKFPVRTWIMPKAGHYYSANIDQIMAEAMDWLINLDT